jgi:hypothetical protein
MATLCAQGSSFVKAGIERFDFGFLLACVPLASAQLFKVLSLPDPQNPTGGGFRAVKILEEAFNGDPTRRLFSEEPNVRHGRWFGV